MGFIGDILSRMSNTQIFVGLVAFILFAGSLGLGAYSHTKSEAEVTCLSCLALVPNMEGFDGNWWVKYPDSYEAAGKKVSHPDFVKSALGSHKAVMIFLWQDACPGCEEQWEDMVDYGTVQGTEKKGTMAMYKDQAKLYTLNVKTDTSGKLAFEAYGRVKGTQGTPTTVILHKMPSGSIGWYAFVGWTHDSEPEMVDNILTLALSH